MDIVGLKKDVEAYTDTIIQIRRKIHGNLELLYKEFETSGFIA